MKTFLMMAVASVSLLAQPPKPAQSAASTKPAPAKAVRKTTSIPPRALLRPALLKAKAPDIFKVQFTTTKGNFVVEVHRVWAPLGADRFYNLVRNGFFTDAAFFRVLPGFVVQFGLSQWPAVNKAWESAKIPDDPVKESNKAGYLTFATAGPGTRTTQLFINLADNAPLDPQGFAPFGMVTEGLDVVQKINPEYKEQPAQDKITDEGKAYLDKNFPNLDRVLTAKVTEPVGAPAPAPRKPVTTTKAAPTKPAPVKPGQ